MTTYCPRCGKPGCDETVVSFVSVWSSCAHCQLVWRSSLLQTVVGYAARGVGLSRAQSVVDQYEARNQAENPELQQPSTPLTPVSADRVAEWLATQERGTVAPSLSVVAHSAAEAALVEEMFDQLDPVGPVKTPAMTAQTEANDFSEFFEQDDLQAPIAAAAHVEQQKDAWHTAEPEDIWGVNETEDAPQDVPEVDQEEDAALDTSSERALSSVEDLYEAFKRLEQQLGTITDSLQTYNPHP